MSDGLIDGTGAPAPAGFRATNSGILVPEAISRDRETWTEEEAKLIMKATRLVNARGWYLTFTCPHERCRSQPIIKGTAIAGGQLLECQHKTVTVTVSAPRTPNAAIARRQQARQARQLERDVVPVAKAMNQATHKSGGG